MPRRMSRKMVLSLCKLAEPLAVWSLKLKCLAPSVCTHHNMILDPALLCEWRSHRAVPIRALIPMPS